MTQEYDLIIPLLSFAGLSLLVIAGKSLIELLRKNYSSHNSLIYGIFFGVVGSLTLMYPITFEAGFFMDMWLPFVALASAFGGPYSSIIAGGIEIASRNAIGGGGASAGMLSIAVTAIFGFLLRNKLASLNNALYFAHLFIVSGLLVVFIAVGSFAFHSVESTVKFFSTNGLVIFAGMFTGTMILGHALKFIDKLLDNQKQLKLNQTHMSIMFDRVRDILLVLAQDGTIRKASNSCFDSIGLKPEQLIGTNLYDIMHPDDANYMRRRALENAPTKSSSSVRMRLKHKDGSWRTVESTRSSFFREGQEYRYIATARDITERLESERALMEREVQLKSIVDNSPSPILLKDLNGKFIVAGKSAEEYVANASTAMLGNTSDEVYPRGSGISQQSTDTDEYVIKHGRTVKYETSYKHNSGEDRHFIVTKFPIKDDNQQVRAIGIIGTDITELKKTENHLRRTQKLEALGQFTGGVAHDFNNLLNVVIGGLETLGDGDLTKEESERVLDMALNSATKGAELTQRLLAYSRKQVLTPKSIDPSVMIRDLRPILSSMTGETIKLDIQTSHDINKINVDSSQLENAIINLVVNARDAMNGDGEINISVGQTSYITDTLIGDTELPKGDYVCITVTDNGSGMPENIIKEATSPFFTTKEVGKGSGLGLSMVHGFINQSGGGMGIESVVGKGTKIRLVIPAAKTTVEETHEIKTESRFSGTKVLIVEDDTDLRKMAVYSFKRMGFEVIEASNGHDALEYVTHDHNIELLFTDVVMPGGLSGVDLSKKLKKSIKNMKVLFTSGYPEMAIQVNQELKKGEEFLHKPYKQRALKEKLLVLFPEASTDTDTGHKVGASSE